MTLLLTEVQVAGTEGSQLISKVDMFSEFLTD